MGPLGQGWSLVGVKQFLKVPNMTLVCLREPLSGPICVEQSEHFTLILPLEFRVSFRVAIRVRGLRGPNVLECPNLT